MGCAWRFGLRAAADVSSLAWQSRRVRHQQRLLRLLVAAVTVVVGLPAVGLAGGTAGATEAAGTGWAIQPIPVPVVHDGSLSSVSCPSTNACTAVGSFDDEAGYQVPLAERWNGTSWSIQPTPNPSWANTSQLNAVSCPAVNDCIAVGTAAHIAVGTTPNETLAERWDGRSWSIQNTPSPPLGRGGSFSAVSCPTATACTAVGSSGNYGVLAERWNGSTWSIQSAPNPSGFQPILSAVSCPSATACTAVGSVQAPNAVVELAERWNGTDWSLQSFGPPTSNAGLTGVSCGSATACTAVGWYGTNIGTGTLVERWDGTRLSRQKDPNPPGSPDMQLNGVSCASATACSAVGMRDTGTLSERWDGTSWSVQPSANPTGTQLSLSGVSCPSATACIAVGSYSNSAGLTVPLAEGLNGTSWSIQSTPSPTGVQSILLSGVSCGSATTCTAVGFLNNGGGSFIDTPRVLLAYYWNGTNWTAQSMPSPPANAFLINGVSCSSATACTAVGSYIDSTGGNVALTERWNGTSWSIQSSPNPPGGGWFNAVSCTSATTCMAVGYSENSQYHFVPLAERWNGTSWSIQTTPLPGGAEQGDLNDVSCSSDTACTAVGGLGIGADSSGPLVESWDGTDWSIQTTAKLPNPRSLNGVSCTSATACTAVGSRASGGTLVERWDGVSWTIQPTPILGLGGTFEGVSCVSNTACTAVGYTGGDAALAEHWDGVSWSKQPMPDLRLQHDGLRSVSCTSAANCTAIGGGSNDGGITGVPLAERYS